VNDERFYRISLAIVLLFVAGFVLKLTRPFVFPFLLAVFMSYIFDPVIEALTKLGIPKAAAGALVLVGAFVVLALLGLALFSSARMFAAELPKYQERIVGLVKSLEEGAAGLPLKIPVTSYLQRIEVSRIAGFTLSAVGSLVGLLSKLLLLFLFLAFIVAGRGRGMAKLRKALSREHEPQVIGVIKTINRQIRKYLVIKTAMSLVNGLTVWIVLSLFHVDFALMFAFLAFLLNYIPSVGSVIAAILRVSFAFFQFGTPWVALWVLIITGGSDTLMGNFVEPRVMGKGLGLSPLVVLFSLLFWGWLWGIPGMIMAVPIVAAVKISCQNIPSLRPAAILMG
jgi:AI-2 transport protein TqsA